MAKTSKRSLFRETALISGLVSKDQIDRAIAALQTRPDDLPTPLEQVSDNELAARLVEMEVITQYQADQLRAGRTKLNLGPYTITDWIGQGGMGQVFKAVHTVMGRQCAIKVLPLNKSTPEAIENFRREIRTQAQLDHPHLVRAYDAGHDGNVHYLVTEYIPGTDLRQFVRGQGPLSMQQAANVIVQAAQGLEHAHERGLIHRDVKPGNILVTPDGIAKVSDLGLSGFIDEAERDPRAGRIVGTADYLSPEQIHSPSEVTSVSDIYSLGCTLYYSISGKVPFPGGTTKDKARRHLEETPWHPRRFNANVSEEFVEVIADMMEKDPKNRTQTAGEVVVRLEPWSRDSSPLRSQQLTKSPWMPPPLPMGDEGLEETNANSDAYEDLDSRTGSASQVSQSTGALVSNNQETNPIRRVVPPPLVRHRRSRHATFRAVAIALAIAIPVSMLFGAFIALVLLSQ
ncbi:MAG: serine/threonine protein kinase [Planctomycetaceae bacterium]|nr:MAG: serine/threonine protein kinase [Planctomycetaceae bacterium]